MGSLALAHPSVSLQDCICRVGMNEGLDGLWEKEKKVQDQGQNQIPHAADYLSVGHELMVGSPGS